ncbi:MAG TPA: acetyl-CoA carboxylase biotin carboxyl carrier protein [Methylomirabilota bacterium]
MELAVRHNLAELEVEAAGTRIRIVREHAPAAVAPRADREPAAMAVPQAPTVELAEPTTHLVPVEAPMVGTFYRAPKPDAPPFVVEGDVVKEGQVLCIVEAMKLMNEIEAKVAGRIVKVVAENGQPVEFGQPLFLVEPLR